MRNKAAIFVLAIGALVLYSVNTNASKKDNEFDQSVTPTLIFGSGNNNGGFTTDRHMGVEIGLRAKTRFPAANDTPGVGLFSNGDGTYSHPAGDGCPGFGFAPLCATTPVWSFDWSVNTNFDTSFVFPTLDQLTYELGMDADPGPDTDFTTFDPITPIVSAPFFDHSVGDNSTTSSTDLVANDPATYVNNLANYNVAQNSWNYEFFNALGTSLASFDPALDGNYVIFLRAVLPGTDKVVAESMIQVLVGSGVAVPRDKVHLPRAMKIRK